MSQTIKRAMILSAGLGTRLGLLTKDTPKPLIEVGGQPILFRVLEALELRGIEEVVINTHYLHEQVHHKLKEWKEGGRSGIKVHISHEEHLLEIGGGIRHVLPYFKGEPFLVVNGDIVWQERRNPWLKNLMEAYDAETMDALLTLSPVEMTEEFRERGGDFVLTEGGHIHFPIEGEEPKHVYAGIQVLHPRMIEVLPQGKGPLRPAWITAQEKGALYGHVYDGEWADMGTPRGLEVAKKLVLRPDEEPDGLDIITAIHDIAHTTLNS